MKNYITLLSIILIITSCDIEEGMYNENYDSHQIVDDSKKGDDRCIQSLKKYSKSRSLIFFLVFGKTH